MKKYELNVRESVIFNHKITVEIPENKDIDEILNETDNEYSFDLDEIEKVLIKNGCTIEDVSRDEDGDSDKAEIDDYYELKGGKKMNDKQVSETVKALIQRIDELQKQNRMLTESCQSFSEVETNLHKKIERLTEDNEELKQRILDLKEGENHESNL